MRKPALFPKTAFFCPFALLSVQYYIDILSAKMVYYAYQYNDICGSLYYLMHIISIEIEGLPGKQRAKP